MITRAGIALGSNLGDSEMILRAAERALAALAVPGEMFLQATHYRTTPVDCPPGSPDFLNTVVELAWACTAEELHRETKRLEREAGRTPSSVRNAPRPLDLDLLYFGEEIISTETLVLPHPRLAARHFVLAPLAEIRPDLILPGYQESIAKLLLKICCRAS